MAGKPRASCPLFLPAQIFPQRQIIKSDFPAFFSDVMPLWFGLIPVGCTKGSWAIWSVILQLWLKHRNSHLVEDASLARARSLWTLAAHVQRRRWYQMQLTLFVPPNVKSFLSLSLSLSNLPCLPPSLLLFFSLRWKMPSVNVYLLRLCKLYIYSTSIQLAWGKKKKFTLNSRGIHVFIFRPNIA